MAPHSSALAWKIPWTEEPGGLQSTRSLRVGHDWATSLSLFTFMHWIRKWQPTPVFLPGESQGRGSLVGCRLWGRTESDTTEATQQQQQRSSLAFKYLLNALNENMSFTPAVWQVPHICAFAGLLPLPAVHPPVSKSSFRSFQNHLLESILQLLWAGQLFFFSLLWHDRC